MSCTYLAQHELESVIIIILINDHASNDNNDITIIIMLIRIKTNNNSSNNNHNSHNNNNSTSSSNMINCFPAHAEPGTCRTCRVSAAACTARMLFCTAAPAGCISIDTRHNDKIGQKDTHIAPTQTTENCCSYALHAAYEQQMKQVYGVFP